MFRKEADFEAFERVMVEAHLRQPLRILSYCVLSNHWHFVVWPEEDGQLTAKESDRVRLSIERGRPYGGDECVKQTVTELGLEHTVRPEGRPRKASGSANPTAS
jgi:hypothetical protein